ncbi:PREDICTED: BTB/POZ domain-containing protein At3g26490 [Tarenaya hassleriana]|uniref:BTB/POZ domain-containing protein At3g26490 n=1 Tax=Tarenaya hassleriana TaxID=28532 RepID=UPI00053C924D|nr:PREDICTED: BTB/POZ domain-containing protein At3g26490 [Tarenaya hassleriana]
MKYMQLGCRPDTFYTAEAVRSVSSEILSDLIIQVKSTRYLLHKFPMLSKCLRLQSLMSSKCPETSQDQVIQLQDFPGEAEAFELCAKFCYGITITLSPCNVIALRCAAEYLEMTEEAEAGNLIQKLELFLDSCVFNSWRDSLLALQSTKALASWSEDLGITGRCIEAISSRVSADSDDPDTGFLPRSYSRRGRDEILCNGGRKMESSRWWGDEIAELCIDLYWRTMAAIKSSNKDIPSRLVGNALRIYASKWLPSVREGIDQKKQRISDSEPGCSKHRLVLESIISLLPTEKRSVPCGFLLQLLKMTNVLKASSSSKTELAIKAGHQLDEATVSDLLIPLSDKPGILYDVDIVMTMVREFLSQTSRIISSPSSRTRTERRRSHSEENINLDLQENRVSPPPPLPASNLKVAKLVDAYLQEIAKDTKLPSSKFVLLAEMIPGPSRVNHDELYKAIDTYLQNHQDIEKGERKRLCRTLDCKKLSPEASKHAAQNELLPLRVIVQILFVKQTRVSTVTNVRTAETEALSRSVSTNTRLPTLRNNIRREEEEEEEAAERGLNPERRIQSTPSRFKAFYAIPTQPKKILSKLLSINRSLRQRI